MGWWRRLSLRARLMLVGTGGLAVGFAAGGVALVLMLGVAVQNSADDDAARTAEYVATLVEDGQIPDPLPVTGRHVAQIVDAQHRVVAASPKADRLVPLLRTGELAEARAGRRFSVPGYRVGETGPMRVVALPVGAGNTDTVIVGRPIADAHDSVRLLRTALLILYPLVLLGLGGVAWRVVGAALRPVETLRAGAERITGTGAEERLPLPPSSDEVHRLAVTLNDMLDRLAAARGRQRAFVADAAHELRSPLTSMRTQLEVAEHTRTSPDPADLLAEVDRLSRLVDDLLLLARADDKGNRKATEPIELRALARDVAARYAGARVPVTLTAGDPQWTAGQPDAVLRIVVNLVDNAVRHASHKVTIEVNPLGPYALITVTDDGPGIPAADRERVFDRFTRLDDARARDAGGAGLGLAIVRELVRQQGGAVALHDAKPGVRAEVRLARLN
jgi:signal transduction histidine kinase